MGLWLLLVGLVGGIVLRIPYPLAVFVCGAALLAPRRAPALTAAGVVIAGIGLGSLTTGVRSPEVTAASALASEVARCEVTGVLREHLGDNSTLAGVELARCSGHPPIDHLGALAFPRLEADAGTVFRAEGWILPLDDEGFEGYLARSGALARFHPSDVFMGGIPSPPMAAAARVKGGLRDAVSSLEPRTGALLMGLTIGDTSRIDPVTEDHLRNAGLTHLVAVSGSNVAIVLGTLLLVFGFLGLRARLTIAALGLVLFVLVTGPEPSVLRAAVMGAIAIAALGLGERVSTQRALGLAVVVVLALRPQLLGSLGLQLSVAATAGIVLWARSIAERLSFLPSPVALGVGATVAAQFAVAPLLAAGFGEVSIAGFPANLLAMPAVAPATVLGFASALAGLASPALGRLLARLAAPFVAAILWIGDLFGGAPWAMVQVPTAVALVAGMGVAGVAAATLVRRRQGYASEDETLEP